MKKETVIITLYPGCISFEVALAAELLSEKYQILNATPDGQDLTDSTGLTIAATDHLKIACSFCGRIVELNYGLAWGSGETCEVNSREFC